MPFGTKWRIAVMITIYVAVIGVLGSRLLHLQVLSQDVFQQNAESQRFRAIREEAPRGEIVDRNGVKLASYRIAYRINLLYPAYLSYHRGQPEPNIDLLTRLAEALEINPQVLVARTEQKIQQAGYYEPLFIKDDVSIPTISLLLEQRTEFPGVLAVPYPIRSYPMGDLAAHIIGYVGQLDPYEYERLAEQGYTYGDVLGKMGLELGYDHILRGKPGRKEIEIDGSYRPTGMEIQQAEREPGKSLRLTLDTALQQTAQDALAQALHYISTVRGVPDGITDASAGAVVVMDVHTGAILAMASYPTFAPSLFLEDLDGAAELLSDAELAPLWNRAISGAYQPGSTWKMLTSLASLQEGVIEGPHETIFCTGIYTKVEPKRDWLLSGHGVVDMTAALAHSCDIYYYEMGYRLGAQRLSDTAALFGFGNPTGIDLPGEAAGWLPNEERRQELEDAGDPWTDGRSLSAGIGQILTTTPLQLARYTAMLANGGVPIQPHLVSAVIDADGVEHDVSPPPGARLDMDPSWFDSVRDGMIAVTEWGTSTGTFRGFPFPVAAKTGTAEVFGQDDYGIYVAFAPAHNPQIAVVVVGERAGKGEWVNPVVKAIFAHYFDVTLPRGDTVYQYGIFPAPPDPQPAVGQPTTGQQPVPTDLPSAGGAPAEPPVQPPPEPHDDHDHDHDHPHPPDPGGAPEPVQPPPEQPPPTGGNV